MRLHRLPTALATGLVLLLLPLGCAHRQPAPVTTVIVVRHAEKLLTEDDPSLSPEGEQRALRLRDMARDADVGAVFATPYRRTQETVEPLATTLGLDVRIVDGSDFTGLAKRILSEHRGSTVVVAGHSNTVPGIVAALGATEPDPIDESQYSNLFVVTVPASGHATVIRLHF